MSNQPTPLPADQMYPFYPFNHPGLVRADAECAVIKMEPFRPEFSGHCGYCVFPKEEIPEAWHGDYNAIPDRIDAHGGITYDGIEGGDIAGREAAIKALWDEKAARYKAIEAAGEEFVNLWSEYYARSKVLQRQFHYTHVVFGFDTAHHMDDQNYALHDADYVFKLAQRMRSDIAEHAAAALAKETAT